MIVNCVKFDWVSRFLKMYDGVKVKELSRVRFILITKVFKFKVRNQFYYITTYQLVSMTTNTNNIARWIKNLTGGREASMAYYVDEEVRVNRHLPNDQLLDITGRYLTILQDRLENKQTIEHQQVHNMDSRRQMLNTIHTILNQCHDLVSSGKARGFVFGLVTENKTWTSSSDNLFKWWKEDVNFEQNGPKAIVPAISESLGLEALINLQDSTLSSIISALMPHCTPTQRVAPFSAGEPVSWWPKGTEEWWPRLNFLRGSGPPEYKMPSSLRKNSKVAVLIAIIKIFETDFLKIRRIVAESLLVQSKMTPRENHIWLAVIKSEEMNMTSSGIESENTAVTNKNVKLEIGDNGDKAGEGESSRAKKKRVACDEVGAVNLTSDTSSYSQGSVSKTMKTSEVDGKSFRWKNLKEVSIAEAEKNSASKNNIPTISQGAMCARMNNMMNLKMLASMQSGGWAGKLSLGSMSGEMQAQSNKKNASTHFGQSLASPTLTGDQVQSSNHSYSIKQDPVNTSQFQSSFIPNMSAVDGSCIKVENHATNMMKRSAFSEPNAVTNSTSVQGSANLNPQVRQVPLDNTHQFQNKFNSISTQQGRVKDEPED